MSTVQSILAEVATLPVSARLALLDAISETIPADELWLKEAQRRSAAEDANPEEPVSAEAFKAIIEARLRNK